MRKLKKILAPLLLALLAASMTTVAFAHDLGGFDRTGEHEGVHDENVRTMDIFTSPTAIGIRSGVHNGTEENHFGLLFTTQHQTELGLENGIVIHVAFSQETEVGDVENEAFLHLRIAYLALTEFDDANGNGAFDAGVDSVVQRIDLRHLTYLPLEQPTPIVSQDGTHGWEIKASSTDGLFGVTADIFPQYAVVNNTIVAPTSTKITTTITGFPFTNPTSVVSLQVMATSKTVIEQETATVEGRIRVRSATAQGFFTWAPTAMVDGVEVPVVASFQRLDRPMWVISLAYPRGTNIVHDPILGFEFGATPLLTGALLVGAALAATGVFGALVYVGRRQLARVFPKMLALGPR